jgi:hypothetical protein
VSFFHCIKQWFAQPRFVVPEPQRVQRIIAGVMYDTATATILYERKWENHYEFSSEYCCERLYRKINGELFLAAWEFTDESWNRVTPVTKEKARKWCECHRIPTPVYEKIFGPVKE